MSITSRLRAASVASAVHLLASGVVALLCAALVFGLWYPYPYSDLVGGRALFLIVVAVDVVVGPLLTLVVFDRRKPRAALVRDLGTVALIQLAALGYGLHSVFEARPVFLAFEGDRFRVVRKPDVDHARLGEAKHGLDRLSVLGPQAVGVRLAQPSDPNYPQSIQLALEGLPPAFRPGRWTPYESQREAVREQARPLSLLREKHPAEQQRISEAAQKVGIAESRLGFVPLVAGDHTDWVVIVSLDDGMPKTYLPLDGFL